MTILEKTFQACKEENLDSTAPVSLKQTPSSNRLSLRMKLSRSRSLKSMKSSGEDLNIGSPYGLTHKVHIDKDLNWSNIEPEKDFELAAKLGEGSFGAVYKGIHKETGRFI